jgi:hypothetical protein
MTSSIKDPYRALHGGARRIGSPDLAGIWKAPFDPAQAVAAGRGRGGVDSGRPTFGRRPERRADGTLRLLRRLGRSVSFVAIIHPPPTDTVRFRGIASNRGAGEECLGGRAVIEASASGEAERQVAADTSGNHALDPNRCPPRCGPLAVSNARKPAHRVNSSRRAIRIRPRRKDHRARTLRGRSTRTRQSRARRTPPCANDREVGSPVSGPPTPHCRQAQKTEADQGRCRWLGNRFDPRHGDQPGLTEVKPLLVAPDELKRR